MFPHGPCEGSLLCTGLERRFRSFARLLFVFLPASFQAAYWRFWAVFRAAFLARRSALDDNFAFFDIGLTTPQLEESRSG